jgi:threonine synthase
VMKEVYNKYNVLLEPHGAAGWAGLQEYFAKFPSDTHQGQLSISLETAHPAKFPEEIRNLMGIEPELPVSMTGLDKLEESFDTIENSYAQFKDYLIGRY